MASGGCGQVLDHFRVVNVCEHVTNNRSIMGAQFLLEMQAQRYL